MKHSLQLTSSVWLCIQRKHREHHRRAYSAKEGYLYEQAVNKPALKITDAILTVERADLLLQCSSIFISSYNISKMSKHPEILWAQRSSASDESKVSLISGDTNSLALSAYMLPLN